MNDAYFNTLTALTENDENVSVTVNRSGAPDVTGTIESITEGGCIIATSEGMDLKRSTFIAFRDIRGVSTSGWDMGAIDK
jgi:hypothetical protein